MIEWIKTKTIGLMAIGWALTAGYAAYVTYSGGIHVDNRTMVTANTSSSSNSSSNSVAVNVNGGQFWGKGGYALTYRAFSSADEMVAFLNSLDEGQRYGMSVVKDDKTFGAPKYVVIYREQSKDTVEKRSTSYYVDGKKVDRLPQGAAKALAK